METLMISDYTLLDALVLKKLEKQREIRAAIATIQSIQDLMSSLGDDPKRIDGLREQIRSLVKFEQTA